LALLVVRHNWQDVLEDRDGTKDTGVASDKAFDLGVQVARVDESAAKVQCVLLVAEFILIFIFDTK
jgi:hypothetical protein